MKLNVNLCLVIGAIVLGVSGQVQAKVDNHNSVDVTRATVSSDSAAGKAITSESAPKKDLDMGGQAQSHSDVALDKEAASH
jgi:hypothetical protein